MANLSTILKLVFFTTIICSSKVYAYTQPFKSGLPDQKNQVIATIEIPKIQEMHLPDYLKKHGNPASEEAILAFEQKHNLTLPDALKIILSFSNGCSPINRTIDMGENTPEYLTDFFSLEWIEASIQNIKSIEAEFHYYFSDVLLPFGDAGGVRYLCIGLAGTYKNNIYIIDYQSYDYKDINSMLTYIGPSIEDLLYRLKPN